MRCVRIYVTPVSERMALKVGSVCVAVSTGSQTVRTG